MRRCLATSGACDSGVIRAHSVQNAVVLDQLAEAGHVLTFLPTEEGSALELVGRNEATTFTGFCGKHDREVFHCIDFKSLDEFSESSTKQLALFSLRAVAREHWLKLNQIAMYEELRRL